MSRPARPDFVVVVRHGARLDAAEKSWHLTSPAPYDPPLTYGGWCQSRTLGIRLAAILDALTSPSSPQNESSRPTAPSGLELKQRPIDREIIIHSSPYLRCIQTAVGISAGLASTNHLSSNSPSQPIVKTRLRVDEFLGEWQTADYFTDISAPPKSSVLVTNAKRYLMQRSSPIRNILSPHSSGHSPGCCHSECASQFPSNPAGDFDQQFSYPSPICRVHHLYTAPVPSYPISSFEPIPSGFVSHARDSCVSVDYQWDSSAPPQNWGSGGDLGEEWSSMHRRFRKGLTAMIEWYGSDHSTHPAIGHKNSKLPTKESIAVPERIVIIVTHGAGCNALLGALTNQPILMDVAMCSISVCHHRPDAPSGPLRRLRSKAVAPALLSAHDHTDEDDEEVWLSGLYDMKIVASTDHLRARSDPARLPPQILSALGLPTGRLGEDSSFNSGDSPDYHRSSGSSIHRTPLLGSSAGYGMPPSSSSILHQRPSFSLLRESYRNGNSCSRDPKQARSQSVSCEPKTSGGFHDPRPESPLVPNSSSGSRWMALRSSTSSLRSASNPSGATHPPGGGLWTPTIHFSTPAPVPDNSNKPSPDFLLNFPISTPPPGDILTTIDSVPDTAVASSESSDSNQSDSPKIVGQAGLWTSERHPVSGPGHEPTVPRTSTPTPVVYLPPDRPRWQDQPKPSYHQAVQAPILHPNGSHSSPKRTTPVAAQLSALGSVPSRDLS